MENNIKYPMTKEIHSPLGFISFHTIGLKLKKTFLELYYIIIFHMSHMSHIFMVDSKGSFSVDLT